MLEMSSFNVIILPLLYTINYIKKRKDFTTKKMYNKICTKIKMYSSHHSEIYKVYAWV